MSLFDDLDLGAGDYDKEKDPGLNQFTSKPIQRQYQPFGGPAQTPQSSIAEPQYAPPEPQPQPQQQYQGGFDDELDYYDQIKKQHSYISRDASAHNSSAKLYEDRYDDFVKTKFKPFYKQFDEFGEFENDDDYFNSLDSLYQSDLKASQEEDGFFGGESDAKSLAKGRLGNYINWNQPNGLRDQYLRLKQEKANRRAMADQMDAQKNALMEQMTNIPIPARMAMDEQLKSRGSGSKPSAKRMNEMLSGMDFEKPVVDMITGEVTNLERTDPRKSIPSAVNMVTGERTKSYGAQQQRQAAAMTGDIQGVIAKRDLTAKERKLRNKGVMFSQNGLMDGYPVGMSRQDVDLLDLAEMKKAGMKSYKGRPLEEVLNELGGQERLQMAQVMRGVYAAKSNYEDAQLQYLKVAGGPKSEALKAKMDEAKESVNKTIGLAAQFGLDNELFEQAETTGWFASLGNAIERGMLMSEMSNYTPDFITNTLDQDEMQKFIEIASEIEDTPTSSAVARYKKATADDKSSGLLDAIGRLVFDNPMAIPEMFLESMASFLPATFKWGAATAGIGAAAGAFKGSAAGAPGIVGGAIAGGSLGARAGWGVASFTLETSGTVLEGMQELGIDWKNPKIFAAAWNNEVTRNAIVKKAVKKGIPIALMDTLSAGMAGRVGGLKLLGLNGGKLIDGASWAQNLRYASAAAPRFTKWQKVSNVGTELGADSALGMAGEYFGQAWSKEPGEAFDYDAIAAEGIIGVGPGIAGGFMEQMRGASNEFTNAPIQYSSQQTTPDGTTGTINRAGFKTPYRTFNSADGMTTGILNMAGIDSSNMADPENATKVMAVQDWIANMWISNPESMTNLRVIVADRTPFADKDNEGSFERDEDGNGVIYMNRKKFNEDPIGAFMHEAGHLARHTMFTNEELLDVYNGLTPDDKLSAFAEYYKRVPNQAFNQYSEREQAEIKKAYNKFQKSKGDIGLADEWFSFQFVRYLAGGKVNPSVKSDMQGWLQKYAYPFLEKFAGSEKLGGSKKDILAARVLSYMGRTPRGFAGAVNPNLQAPDMPGTETDFNSPGIRAPKGANVLDGLSDSEGLNHLVSRIMEEFATPQERADFAKSFNTFIDRNVLPTKPSFYTQAEMETAAGAYEDVMSSGVDYRGPDDKFKFAEKVQASTGGKLAQEIRKLEELLARGRVEKIKEADFAEPDVTEFAEETDPKKKKEAAIARRKRQGSKKDTTKYPDEGFDQNDTGARVGRSPRNIAREKEQYNVLGKRYRATLTMPGYRGEESRVEYYATKEEADKAVADFLEKQNNKRIKRIQGKHKKAFDILKDDAKFKKAYDEATKKLGDESSIHARIAEALGLNGLMSESLFGAAYSARHLGENKVHGGGVKGAVKAPSMREVQNDLFMSDAEQENALELLQNREAELVREIERMKGLLPEAEAEAEAEAAPAKEPKEKAVYSKTKVVQFVPLGKNKGYEVRLIKEGEAKPQPKGKVSARVYSQYAKKLTETANIPEDRLKTIKPLIAQFKKAVDKKYHGQIMFWLQQDRNAKPADKSKPAKKKEQPDRDIFTQGRGLVKLSGEIKDAERALKFVRQYKDVIAPEAKSFMWADLPHPSYYVDKEGTQRLTLGVLAKKSGKLVVYENKKGKLRYKNLSNPQQTLLDFVIGESKYDGSKRGDFKFLEGTGMSKEDYALHVESIPAAILNPKDGMLKPLGNMSIDSKGNQRVEDYFGGFQADKGTNYFLFAVHKAAQIEKGKGNAVKLVSDNPTLEELAMYEVADGKAYEDKGGSYESRMQFRYFNLIERMAKEAQSKIKALGKAYNDLEPNDPERKAIMTSIKNLTDYQEKLFPSVDDIANYAEENQYFPKVKQATRFADVFGEYLYYDEMLKAVDKFYDYVEGDINIDGRSDIIERLAVRKGQYEEAKKNAEEDSNKSKKEQKELFSGLNIDLGIDQGETTFEENKDGTLYVSPEGVVGKTLKQAGYDYREIDEDTDEDIAPREGVHGGFKRREVDRGFDIMAVLREIAATNPDSKELKERLKTLVPSRYETTFLTEFVRPEPNTRITYNHDGKDRTVEWRENEFGEGYWVGGTLGENNKALTDKYTLSLINDEWMSQVDKEVLQSVGELDMVTAAELADFLFRGNSISDLSMIPSSKDSGIKNITSGDGKKSVSKQQDMTGGPGGGMLPFVFEAFIKEMYQRLNIKDFETEATVSEFIDPIKTKTAKVKVNGIDATLIVDENGMAAVYSKDSDGEAMRTIDVPKDEVEKLVQEKFGKDTKAVVADLKKEDEAEGQKPKEQAKGQRNYKKVKLKYSANQWFVDGKLVDRSLFAESAKHPEFDYMQAALAPIIQAVVDARRVDIFNTGKRNEKIVNPRDTSYDPNSEKGADDAPEGSFDNQETETDTRKDGAKLDQKDLEQESKDGDEFKTLGDNENIPQAASTKADAFASKLSGTDTNKKLFNLKKGRKQPLDLLTIVKLFKNDPVLWEAFDMPTPKNNVMDKKPFDSYVKDLKKHPNYPAFEARVLSPGTQALGSSYSLSSGIPDNYGKLSILSRLASKAGVSEEDKEKYKKILSGFDFKTSLVDQADPPKQMVANFLKSVGIKDQALIDAIDVHGKWHQYYGKGYNTVEQSQIRFIEPIKDAMAKHGVTNSMLGEYLLARAAPSRNMHLKEMYQAELKTLEKDSKEYKSLKKMLDERGDSLSGINTKDAIDRLKEMEAMDPIKNFILDENNPLQLFYDMNREALMLKSESGLIRQEGDINEAKAMILAMSKYNINNISRARMKDNYNYAPMQGFEGETEKLFDNEMAYEAVGKSSTAAGRGWDQPKHAFLQNGAFGRTNTNIGPDPETVFAAAQSQYFDAAIRSHKNEVSNAFGKVYEIMRAIAYPDAGTGLPNVELPDELKNLSPDVKKKVKAEFDQIFEKEFKELDTKKDYEIQEKDIEIDGQKVDGLKMVRRTLSTKFQNDPYVFVYRKDGEPLYIKFKGEPGARMAASLKNLRYESLPRILQLINKMTRFMAQMFTSMNPAFIIPNFIRDVGTAAIHLSEDDKKNMVGKTLSGKRLGKFMKAIFKVEQSISKGENIKTDLDINEVSAMQLLREGDHQKMYQFAKQAGAKIGYFRHKSIPELIEDVRNNKAANKKGAIARLKGVGQLVDSMNTAVENSIRMSAFWSAIETGRSVHQAASISRNVTVDFNQKGNLTQAFGSLFVFFGASTNSAHRFARTLHKRGKAGSAKLIGGIVAASFVVALFNRLMDDDEDEEMPDYDTITHFKRDTNLLLPLPGNIPGLEDKTGRDTGYFGIPVPLGYNVFWALGQTTADFFAKYVMDRGGAGGMEFFTRNLEAGLNAFNPIGGATLQTALVPTAGKPIVEMYANKNFMGTEIRKSDVPYEAPKPAHMMDQKRTQQHWTDLSRFINKTLGGNDEIKGSIGGLFGGNPLLSSEDSDYRFDLSGSEMEHLALGYLGGPGQIVNMFFGDGLYPAMDDKEYNLDINKMPVVNRFIRTSTYGSATRRSYYQIREAAMIAKKAVEAAKKKGGAEFATMQKNQKPLIDIMPQIKAMDGKRSKLRDMKNKIENSKTFTKSQKMQRIEELERKELNMITAVIKKAQSLGIS